MSQSLIDKRYTNVYGIYGHLGGGKTLSAVDTMIDFLKAGYTVVSNVQLRHIEGFKGQYQYLDDFHQVNFWKLPCGAPRGSPSSFRSLIVIDEAAEFMDQYSSNSPVVKSFISWLRHSSKRGQFVILIVQSPTFLVKSARTLVNRWIRCDDMAQIKLPILRISNPLFRDTVRRLVFDRDGNCISRGLNLLCKTEIGRYYDTAQSIATEGREHSSYEYTEPPIDLSPFIWVCFFGLLIFKIFTF